MIGSLAWSDAPDLVIRLAAVIVALGVLHRLGLGIWRTARRIEDTFDLVHHELQKNSGTSLRDAVDRIDESQAELRSIAEALAARVGVLERREGGGRRDTD